MTVIVITGSTRGIGHGLARAFLARGCRVVINGRRQESVDAVVTELASEFGATRVAGQAGDVSVFADMQALWNAGVAAFDQVDIWINNAALGAPEPDFWELDPDTMAAVVQANLVGTMYGCKVAITGMLAQGHGYVYNMEGWGSQGEARNGSGLYGSTKAGLTYLNKILALELKDTPVKLGTLNPGMVLTDMFHLSVHPGREEQAKRILNILGDRLEDVSEGLADRILANDRHNKRIAWLTTPQMMLRFATAPFSKRDIVGDVKLGVHNQ